MFLLKSVCVSRGGLYPRGFCCCNIVALQTLFFPLDQRWLAFFEYKFTMKAYKLNVLCQRLKAAHREYLIQKLCFMGEVSL